MHATNIGNSNSPPTGVVTLRPLIKDADMEEDTLWFKPLFWKAGDFHSALGVSNRGALEQTEN